MGQGRDTIVFIPAWNEEESLPSVIGELRGELPDADVVVIDDGSTDGTADIARGAGADVVSFGENRGLRAGIAAGYAYALEQEYDYCGRVDADGQHPAAELRRLLERVRSDACDVAIGSRFLAGDGYEEYRYRPSGARRFGTGVLRRSMKVALRRPFHDATSGMYAANRKALPVLALPYTSDAPEVQAILRLHEAGLRVDEVPVNMRDRAVGESKLQGKKALMLVLTVTGTLLAVLRARRHRVRSG
jgi:glycosyltransferase involved in cell wall biosynthesis